MNRPIGLDRTAVGGYLRREELVVVGISKELTGVGSNDIPGRINSSAGDLHRGNFVFRSFRPIMELLPVPVIVSVE